MVLSPLAHTWIFDVDGTIVKHNGYLIDGYDTLLDGVKEFFDYLPSSDCVILTTARPKERLVELQEFLYQEGIRYNHILTDIPAGERILINDMKPSGLHTAYAVNKKRDGRLEICYIIDKDK